MLYEFPGKNIDSFLEIPTNSDQSSVFIGIGIKTLASPNPTWLKNAIMEGRADPQTHINIEILIHAQCARWYIHPKKVNANFLVGKLNALAKSGVKIFLVDSIESNYLKRESVEFGSMYQITI